MGGFGEATAVRQVGEGRYEVALDPSFSVGPEALHGGYLVAVLLRAAIDASPHPHPVATSTNFLRAAQPGPAEVIVEPRKTGRTAAVARVTLRQEGQPVVDAQVTTGTLAEDTAPVWTGEQPPLPPVEECVSFERRSEDGFARQVDMQYDRATMGWLDGQPSGTLEMRAHFQLREPAAAGAIPDALVLALAVDALPPVTLGVGAYGWAPTVELTWHMRAVPVPGPLALHGKGRLVSDGWFDEEVEVWDSAGRLVAQSRQLARVGRGRALDRSRAH